MCSPGSESSLRGPSPARHGPPDGERAGRNRAGGRPGPTIWLSASIALVAVVGALCLARRALPTPRRRSLRILAAIGTLVVGAIAFLPTWMLAMSPLRSGTWTCIVCGATTERESYAGIPIKSNTPIAFDLELTQPYHDWYVRSIATEHRHDWRMIGCHRVGAGKVACTMRRAPASLLMQSLPELPDQTLARAMVERLLDASPAERSYLTRNLTEGSNHAGPFARIAGGESLTQEEFAEQHRVWLERNEEWR